MVTVLRLPDGLCLSVRGVDGRCGRHTKRVSFNVAIFLDGRRVCRGVRHSVANVRRFYVLD